MISPISTNSIRPPLVVKQVVTPDSVSSPFSTPGATGAAGDSASLFRSLLSDSIQQVQNRNAVADQTVQQFLTGDTQDLHEVAIATQKAELGFEFFLQTRNKVVQAYQEVMRMQL